MTPFRTYRHNKPETWANHQERFEIWLDGKGVTTDDQKRGLLLDALDYATICNLKNWISPRTLKESTYQQLVLKLDEKITPSINWLVHFSTLTRRVQKPNESAAEFMAEVKLLADGCGFTSATSRLILGQFVQGLRDVETQTKLLDLHATLNAETALTMVEMVEQAKINSAAVRGIATPECPISNIEESGSSILRMEKRKSPNALPTQKRKFKCYRCGDPHTSRTCP